MRRPRSFTQISESRVAAARLSFKGGEEKSFIYLFIIKRVSADYCTTNLRKSDANPTQVKNFTCRRPCL